MHGYCSNNAYLYTFTLTDVGIFLVKMCNMMHFLYHTNFATADAVALTMPKPQYTQIILLLKYKVLSLNSKVGAENKTKG